MGEVREIAEPAFIYGFPMVVGYSVMYEYAIDEEAAEFKAPFNRIFNTALVYTAKDTAVVIPIPTISPRRGQGDIPWLGPRRYAETPGTQDPGVQFPRPSVPFFELPGQLRPCPAR